MNTTLTPKIYVACLAAYNAGILHGAWIDANQDIDQLWNEVNEMLAASPEEGAEEWAIHDFEDFGSLRLSEYEGIESVQEIAEFIGEYDELGAELLSHFCGDLSAAQTAQENHYVGCYSSVSDYAQELTEEITEIPENLTFYIDYESMGRDMEMNDVFTITTRHSEVHIFWNF